jgi:hypothetical protein
MHGQVGGGQALKEPEEMAPSSPAGALRQPGIRSLLLSIHETPVPESGCLRIMRSSGLLRCDAAVNVQIYEKLYVSKDGSSVGHTVFWVLEAYIGDPDLWI